MAFCPNVLLPHFHVVLMSCCPAAQLSFCLAVLSFGSSFQPVLRKLECEEKRSPCPGLRGRLLWRQCSVAKPRSAAVQCRAVAAAAPVTVPTLPALLLLEPAGSSRPAASRTPPASRAHLSPPALIASRAAVVRARPWPIVAPRSRHKKQHELAQPILRLRASSHLDHPGLQSLHQRLLAGAKSVRPVGHLPVLAWLGGLGRAAVTHAHLQEDHQAPPGAEETGQDQQVP